MKNALLVILIIFWKILVFFPRRFQNFIATVLGHFINWLPLKRNRISKVNIDLCFKDLSQKDRDNIHKKNTIEFAKVIFDTGISWFWSDNRIKKNIPYKINGLQAILNNQNDKNGILLLFKHSLHLELDSRILAMHAEIYGIEREHNSKMFENIQRSGRLKSMKGITDRDNTLTFMRWLKKGKTVLYAPDQDYGLDKLESHFTTKLSDLKFAPFYGCYMVRPSEALGFNERPERKMYLEQVIESCGAEAIDFPGKFSCCGFPILFINQKNSLKNNQKKNLSL